MIKISIITINYNNAIGLKRTLDSIVAQTWGEFEHIIIDGGSTDDSVSIIQSYITSLQFSNQLLAAHTIWSSEKDKGIYDAMNKGICKANGEYCLFLNSGDILASDSVLQSVIQIDMKASIVCGDSIFEASKYHKMRHIISPDVVNAGYLILNYLPHQSSFIKRDLFEKIHLYDTDFQVVSDWLFFIEVLLVYRESYQHIPILVSCCDTEGISNNPDNCNIFNEEFKSGMQKVMPAFLDDYIELRELRKEVSRPIYKFFKENELSFWFKIAWKLHRLKTRYLK